MTDFDFYSENLYSFPQESEMEEREDIPYFGSFPELFESFHAATGYHIYLVRRGGAFPGRPGRPGGPGGPGRPGGPERPEKDASNASAGDGAIEFLIRIPVENSLHRVLGTLVVWKDEKASEYMKESLVTKLAKGVAATVNETYRWVYVLRENKMGQAVRALHPETQPSQKDVPLAEQIRKILKDGARLIVCQAASLYLLDQETTLLNLSACWGLPDDRLTEPPRPLKSARADLEALLGNAVILNEEHLTDYWRVPETFATSLCVPVASDDTILGTLWFFSDSRRRFGVSDMAVIEMIAGRLTAELEKRAIRSDYACFRKLSELERGSSSSSSRAAM